MDNYFNLKAENKQLKLTVAKQEQLIEDLRQELDRAYEEQARDTEWSMLMEGDE